MTKHKTKGGAGTSVRPDLSKPESSIVPGLRTCPLVGVPCPDAEAVGVLCQLSDIGYVLSGVCHEMGNPINSVLAALTVLERKADRLSSDDIRWYGRAMREQLERVVEILVNLRGFDDSLLPAIRIIDLNEFLGNFLSVVRRDFERMGVSISLNPAPRAIRISADPRKLHHALLGFIRNSAEAFDDTSGSDIWIDSKLSSGRVTILVRDNGPGFPQSVLESPFHPFFTTKEKAAGLGLFMAEKTLSSFGFTVAIRNALPNGAVVEVSAPLQESV